MLNTDELLALMKEWKDEVKGLISDYEKMAAKLDGAVTAVEASEKKPWVVYKTHITVAVTVVGILLAVLCTGLVMRATNICIVNVNADGKGYAITSCSNVKVDKNGQETLQTTN